MGLDIYFRSAPRSQQEHPAYSNTEEVAYFRKFNALHRWFVDNVQNGRDDCGYYSVTKETLSRFISILNALDEENCKDLLPTKEGFFFGNTEYGEMYWSDVNEAKETLVGILATFDFEKYTLFYKASW